MSFVKKFQTTAIYLFPTLYHSHKKRKDSLETRAKRPVLRAYVENEAILEPILLYRASTPILPSYVINIRVFSFLCHDTNILGSNFVKKDVATLQRNKLALYQTQNGGPN